MIRSFTRSFALLALLALVTPASAQHAKFVLFGDPAPEAAKAAPEHQFVHPVTSPYWHEDSFVTSDLRAWFAYHNFPKSSTIGGGDANVYAVQARLAITNQLQLVAYKDGFLETESGLAPVNEDGWQDIAAGLKWNFLQDFNNQLHAAVGVGYQFDLGDHVLADDQELRVWGSINKGFDRLHLGATVNFFLANDKGNTLAGNSDHVSWHVHADYYVCKWFSPVVEFNGYHVVDEGTVVVPFQGVDVANLGGTTKNDVITFGVGAEFRPIDNVGIRAAYEMPLTEGDQLFGYRWTFSVVFSF